MKLNVVDRITILEILPAEANYVIYRIINNLRDQLSFSEEELKENGIVVKTVGDKTLTSWKKNEEKEFTFGERATDIIVDALKKLDEAGKLTARTFLLYEKFIKSEENGK
jgi:hypothetical protein